MRALDADAPVGDLATRDGSASADHPGARGSGDLAPVPPSIGMPATAKATTRIRVISEALRDPARSQPAPGKPDGAHRCLGRPRRRSAARTPGGARPAPVSRTRDARLGSPSRGWPTLPGLSSAAALGQARVVGPGSGSTGSISVALGWRPRQAGPGQVGVAEEARTRSGRCRQVGARPPGRRDVLPGRVARAAVDQREVAPIAAVRAVAASQSRVVRPDHRRGPLHRRPRVLVELLDLVRRRSRPGRGCRARRARPARAGGPRPRPGRGHSRRRRPGARSRQPDRFGSRTASRARRLAWMSERTATRIGRG